MNNCSHYTLKKSHTCKNIWNSIAYLEGRAAWIPCAMHNATHSLYCEIESCFVFPNTLYRKALNRSIYKLGIHSRQSFIIQLQLFYLRWNKICDEYIRLSNKLLHYLVTLRIFEIQSHALLVPINWEVVCAVSPSKWRAPLSCLIADPRLLNLNDLCSHIS